MSDVSFYHLVSLRLEDVLPRLLTKCLDKDMTVVVKASSQERVDMLDDFLWSYDEEAFLPHGTQKDGDAEFQPIFISCLDENPNHASVCFLIDAATLNDVSVYSRVIYIFDGQDEDALLSARQYWKLLKGQGHALTYWQQNDHGGWEQKA